MNNKHKIAFIGYGEVGQLFASQLLAQGNTELSCFDSKFLTEKDLPKKAQENGVYAHSSLRNLIIQADIIFSAVTASNAQSVALEAAKHMKKGQIFFDINSASPNTKSQSSKAFILKELDYVEGAVMGPVADDGLKVNILTGGEKAKELSERLNILGMNCNAISPKIGIASATKLSRSIMIKGIEALILDCTRAASAWGVEEEVYASLNKSFQSADWANLAIIMPKRIERHGIRRAEEMREAASMVADLGLNPTLIEAVAQMHEAYAKEKKA